MMKQINSIKPKILNVLKKYPIARAGVFGSYARGEANKQSDVDILIEIKGGQFSLIDIIGLEMELKKALKRRVDILTYKGISPYLRSRILKEEVRIV